MGFGRDSGWAVWVLALTLVASGTSSAEESVPAIQLEPGGPRIPLADLYMNLEEFQDFDRQPEPEQRRRLEAILSAHPDAVGARFLRLQAEQFPTPDIAAMLSDSELALESPALDHRLRPQILAWRAEALIQARRLKEALSAAGEAVDIGGAQGAALFARGWASFLLDDEKAESAIEDLDKALALRPEQSSGYYRRAVVRQKLGQWDLAAKDFEHAAQVGPNDGPNYREYGVLLLHEHEPERALTQFNIASSLMPTDPLTWVWLAQANRDLQRLDAAAADERRADELGAAAEELSDAHVIVASVLHVEHDFSGVARQLRRALALKPDQEVAAWFERALWYSGDFQGALTAYHDQKVAPLPTDYVPLWLFIMRGRAAADETAASAELAASAPAHQPHAWMDTLVDLMLGRANLDAALAEADESSSYELKAGRRCEADYYFAERLLMHAQEQQASRLLGEAYWVCPSAYFEANAVASERRRLEATVPAR